MITLDEILNAIEDRTGIGNTFDARRIIGSAGDAVANSLSSLPSFDTKRLRQAAVNAYNGAGIALEGIDSLSRDRAAQTAMMVGSMVPGVNAVASPFLVASLANEARDPYVATPFPEKTARRGVAVANKGSASIIPSGDAPIGDPNSKEIVRGPGSDGVYRVKGDQRYEGPSRKGFSRSNKSIGEQATKRELIANEIADSMNNFYAGMLKTGVVPDAKAIGGFQDFAEKVARARLGDFGPSNPEPSGQAKDDGESAADKTKLALMLAAGASIADGVLFKGKGRRALGGQLGKLKGRFGLAAKEAKAVEAVSPDLFKMAKKGEVAADLSALDSGIKTRGKPKAADLSAFPKERLDRGASPSRLPPKPEPLYGQKELRKNDETLSKLTAKKVGNKPRVSGVEELGRKSQVPVDSLEKLDSGVKLPKKPEASTPKETASAKLKAKAKKKKKIK